MNKTMTNSFSNKPKQWFTLEEDNRIYGDRLPYEISKKISLLGKGGFAVVFKAVYDYKEIALKQVSKVKNFKMASDVNAAKNEIKVQNAILNTYSGLRSERNYNILQQGYNNISKMVFNSQDNSDVWIGYELGGETLQNLTFKIKGTFHQNVRMYNIEHLDFLQDMLDQRHILKDFMRRVLSVIHLTSSLGIVHGDLKPENILVDYNNNSKTIHDLKVIDFGTSYNHTSKAGVVATPEYSPPEQLREEGNKGAGAWAHDMFSLGVIVLEMLLGWPVWLSMKCLVKHMHNKQTIQTVGLFSVPMRDKRKVCEKQMNCLKNLEKVFASSMTVVKRDPELEALVSSMLNPNPSMRISPIEALNHHYLK